MTNIENLVKIDYDLALMLLTRGISVYNKESNKESNVFLLRRKYERNIWFNVEDQIMDNEFYIEEVILKLATYLTIICPDWNKQTEQKRINIMNKFYEILGEDNNLENVRTWLEMQKMKEL